MRLELKYETSFDKSWKELKKNVKKYLEDNDCITDKGKIEWPCWVNIVKREKEQQYKH